MEDFFIAPMTWRLDRKKLAPIYEKFGDQMGVPKRCRLQRITSVAISFRVVLSSTPRAREPGFELLLVPGDVNAAAWLTTAAAVVAVTSWENSEVSPLGSVAVALIDLPVVSDVANETENVALPLESVVTVVVASSVCPCPKPDGSGVSLAKNWIV